MRRATAHAALTVTALAFVVCTFLFSALPGVDLFVSATFVRSDGQFMGQTGVLQFLRHSAWHIASVFALFSLAMAVLQGILRPSARVATRVWTFSVLSFVIGPGVIVNAWLKAHWGRARPRSIEDFGGEATFTPVLAFADQCARNCSFASGEAAGILTFALVVSLSFGGALRDSVRAPALFTLWCAALFLAFLRVVMGGHFLSDVVFAGLISALVTLSLYLALRMEDYVAGATPANAWRDVRDMLTSLGRRLALGMRSRKP